MVGIRSLRFLFLLGRQFRPVFRGENAVRDQVRAYASNIPTFPTPPVELPRPMTPNESNLVLRFGVDSDGKKNGIEMGVDEKTPRGGWLGYLSIPEIFSQKRSRKQQKLKIAAFFDCVFFGGLPLILWFFWGDVFFVECFFVRFLLLFFCYKCITSGSGHVPLPLLVDGFFWRFSNSWPCKKWCHVCLL